MTLVLRLITLSLPWWLLCSCTAKSQLALFSRYMNREDLASHHVRTPDPALHCPELGEHIYVEWNVKPQNFRPPMQIHLRVYFGDRTEHSETIDLLKRCGRYVYVLKNEAFFEKRGIQSYKAELLSEGVTIEIWRHLLWVEKISFESEAAL